MGKSLNEFVAEVGKDGKSVFNAVIVSTDLRRITFDEPDGSLVLINLKKMGKIYY